MDCALFVDCCICRHSSVGIGIKELGGQTPSPSPSCPLPSPPFLPPFPFGPPKQGLKYHEFSLKVQFSQFSQYEDINCKTITVLFYLFSIQLAVYNGTITRFIADDKVVYQRVR